MLGGAVCFLLISAGLAVVERVRRRAAARASSRLLNNNDSKAEYRGTSLYDNVPPRAYEYDFGSQTRALLTRIVFMVRGTEPSVN